MKFLCKILSFPFPSHPFLPSFGTLQKKLYQVLSNVGFLAVIFPFHCVCPCCSLENCNAWYNCTTLATITPFQFHTPLTHSERCTGMKSSSLSGQTEIDNVFCAVSNVLWNPPQRDERLFLVSAADIKVYFQSSMGHFWWNGLRLRDIIRFSRSISCWPTNIGVFLITIWQYTHCLPECDKLLYVRILSLWVMNTVNFWPTPNWWLLLTYCLHDLHKIWIFFHLWSETFFFHSYLHTIQ